MSWIELNTESAGQKFSSARVSSLNLRRVVTLILTKCWRNYKQGVAALLSENGWTVEKFRKWPLKLFKEMFEVISTGLSGLGGNCLPKLFLLLKLTKLNRSLKTQRMNWMTTNEN